MAVKNIRLKHEEMFLEILCEIKRSSRFNACRKFIQHGSVSVFVHSIR